MPEANTSPRDPHFTAQTLRWHEDEDFPPAVVAPRAAAWPVWLIMSAATLAAGSAITVLASHLSTLAERQARIESLLPQMRLADEARAREQAPQPAREPAPILDEPRVAPTKDALSPPSEALARSTSSHVAERRMRPIHRRLIGTPRRGHDISAATPAESSAPRLHQYTFSNSGSENSTPSESRAAPPVATEPARVAPVKAAGSVAASDDPLFGL